MFYGIFGIFGGVLGMSASLPQIIKSLYTLQTDDLHIGSNILRLLSALSWSVYGATGQDWVLVGSSSVVGTVELILIFVTLYSRKRNIAYDQLEMSESDIPV